MFQGVLMNIGYKICKVKVTINLLSLKVFLKQTSCS